MLRIDPEFQSLIPAPTAEERQQLERNIKADGCREEITAWQGAIIDGHNRHEICTRLGINFRVVERDFPDRNAAKVWIIRNQFGRRNISLADRCALALTLEPLIASQAKSQQIRKPQSVSSTLTKQKPIDTRETVAKEAGVSTGTLTKYKTVQAKASEPIKAKLRSGDTTINKEYKAIVKAERHEKQVAAVRTAQVPTGKYHVIVADPPWSYDSRAADSTHRAANPYPSMNIEQIKKMPVESMAMDDAVLWLWTTNAFMVEAHEVAEAWGFEVKTILTWAKDRMGTGDWLRGQTEHCLMAVRGKPVVTLTNQTTLLSGPLRQHSRKPDEFYAMVDALCPGTKCELFSRQKRDGWTAAGAEIEKFAA